MPFDKFLLSLLASAALLACSSVPPQKPPAIDVPAAFKEGQSFVPVNPDTANVPDAWWTLFNDPVLNDLQQQLLSGNQSLAGAAAAVAVAQAAVASSRAGFFPTVGVSAGANRSANVATSPKGTSYSVQGAMSNWELDLWGRIAATVDAANAKYQASRYTLAATRLSQQALLAQTYFSLRASDALASVLAQTVTAYARSLDLTQNRYQGGVASAADVAQAQTQLQSAQAQRVEAQLQRAQLEHAVAGLLGRAPAALHLAPPGPRDLLEPPQVPLQLPSALLARRPDIAAAAAQVAAANAQIGAAQAAFLPALTLSASGGFRYNDLGALIAGSNKFWSLGPSFAMALLDGGAKSAASDAARASYDQTVASYKQTVLSALQEVEDNLVAAQLLQQEMQLQELSLTSARRALNIAQNQYKAGTVSYLNVVTAQTTVLSTERSLLDVRNRRLAAVNQLLKNIAGRWDGMAG